MFNEFKAFAIKGNVVDLAVAVIIGGAFGKIVTSFVNDVVMPFIGMFMGGVDFGSLYKSLDGTSYESLAAAEEAGAAIVKYGAFTQTIIDFIIIAFVIFMVVRAMNKMKKKEEAKPAAAPKKSDEAKLLEEIRDALKKK